MRRINKPLELAIKYKEWHDELEIGKHPKYTSSSNQHYYSIVANLFWVQAGLCAYTECVLADIELVRPENWKDGVMEKFEFTGQLDHFDPDLKTGNGWLWSNFLMANSDMNSKVKRDYKVNYLKPDKEDFDPHYYLKYDKERAMFYPNLERTDEEKQKLLDDIEVLGINHATIVLWRKQRLTPILKQIEYKAVTIEAGRTMIHEFFTAYEMAVAQLEQ